MTWRFRLDTVRETEAILDALHQIWLGKIPPDPEDARQVRDGFAYYYENFPEIYTGGRIALADLDGEIASVAGQIPFPLAHDLFAPLGAQLNPVGTRREHREQGLARGCIELLCDRLRGQGCSLFFVCGVSAFYPRLGFYPAFDEYRASIPVDLPDSSPAEPEVRPCAQADATGLLDVYQRTSDHNLFHLRRDRDWIARKLLPGDESQLGTICQKEVLVAEKENRITGYTFLNHRDDALVLPELRGLRRVDLLALLRAAATQARRRGIAELRVDHATPATPLHPLALDLRGRVEVVHPRHLMLKILSVEKLLIAMSDLFGHRLLKSSRFDTPFSLTLSSYGEIVSLSWDGAAISVRPDAGNPRTLHIPDPVLVELVTGHRSLSQQIDAGACPPVADEIIDLFDLLFPAHYPYIYHVDFN